MKPGNVIDAAALFHQGTDGCAEPTPQPAVWPGHLPVTQRALMAIMVNATSGTDKFKWPERILYTACERWAAIARADPAVDMELGYVERLQTDRFAFTAIGAEHVARSLESALMDIRRLQAPEEVRARLAELPDELLSTRGLTDQILAAYAASLLEKSAPFDETCAHPAADESAAPCPLPAAGAARRIRRPARRTPPGKTPRPPRNGR